MNGQTNGKSHLQDFAQITWTDKKTERQTDKQRDRHQKGLIKDGDSEKKY